MLTPIVTEVRRAAEPVVRDTFIGEFDGRAPREQQRADVVALAAYRSLRRNPAPVPARAA